MLYQYVVPILEIRLCAVFRNIAQIALINSDVSSSSTCPLPYHHDDRVRLYYQPIIAHLNYQVFVLDIGPG